MSTQAKAAAIAPMATFASGSVKSVGRSARRHRVVTPLHLPPSLTPSLANSTAPARLMPKLPPLIRATLPVKLHSIVISPSGRLAPTVPLRRIPLGRWIAAQVTGGRRLVCFNHLHDRCSGEHTPDAKAVADATGPEFQLGVQIMLNALKASVAVAKVCGGSFLRCTALVGATVTAAGMVEADPHDFLTYRARIGAQQIKLIAEVNSMHFRWLGDKPTADVARMAACVGADAVEVAHPDEATNARLVRDIKQAMPHLPVILGGHTTHDNVARRLAEADGVFVGSCLKANRWHGRVDVERVRAYVNIVDSLG